MFSICILILNSYYFLFNFQIDSQKTPGPPWLEITAPAETIDGSHNRSCLKVILSICL